MVAGREWKRPMTPDGVISGWTEAGSVPSLGVMHEPGTAIIGTPPRYSTTRLGSSYPTRGFDVARLTQDVAYAVDYVLVRAARPPIFEHLQTLTGQSLERFDSTSLAGEPDPVWSLAAKLREARAQITMLKQQRDALTRQLADLRSPEGVEQEVGGDAVVFGTPKRVIPMQLQMIGSRRGSPLIVDEFDE